MAITDREIITNQVRRINEKMKTNFVLEDFNDTDFCLCRKQGEKIMPPFPLSNDIVIRSLSFMIEYLAGVEDAVDFFTHNGTK